MRIHTFYRKDGTEFRCRAEVHLAPLPLHPSDPDPCHVTVQTKTALRKFTGGETWGNGRFAPVTSIMIA